MQIIHRQDELCRLVKRLTRRWEGGERSERAREGHGGTRRSRQPSNSTPINLSRMQASILPCTWIHNRRIRVNFLEPRLFTSFLQDSAGDHQSASPIFAILRAPSIYRCDVLLAADMLGYAGREIRVFRHHHFRHYLSLLYSLTLW